MIVPITFMILMTQTKHSICPECLGKIIKCQSKYISVFNRNNLAEAMCDLTKDLVEEIRDNQSCFLCLDESVMLFNVPMHDKHRGMHHNENQWLQSLVDKLYKEEISLLCQKFPFPNSKSRIRN